MLELFLTPVFYMCHPNIFLSSKFIEFTVLIFFLGANEFQSMFFFSIYVMPTCRSFWINFPTNNSSLGSCSVSWVNVIIFLKLLKACTYKIELDYALLIPNLKLIRKKQYVDPTICRKPAASNMYLHWHLFALNSWNTGTLKSMVL